MSPVVGRPLSLVYSSVMRARNWSYDSWLKPSPQFSVPVISIGNLTVGGTGKTPFVDHLLQWCRSQNIVAGVISRGYGGNFSGVKRVDAKDNPEKVGDEPWMLFQRHLQTPIYVCADRVQAARELLIQNPSVNLIIADDAFQHRRLYRDMDIVILDMMESQENYLVLPEGRARESFQGLLRANFVILNKINLAPAEYSLQVKEELKSIDFPEENILESHYHPHQILNVCDRQTFWPKEKQRVLLVSGIGRPSSFEALVQLQSNVEIVDHLIFPDHHKFSMADVVRSEQLAQELSCQNILCTQKDMGKLEKWVKKTDQWFYLDLQLKLVGNIESFYEKVVQLVS